MRRMILEVTEFINAEGKSVVLNPNHKEVRLITYDDLSKQVYIRLADRTITRLRGFELVGAKPPPKPTNLTPIMLDAIFSPHMVGIMILTISVFTFILMTTN